MKKFWKKTEGFTLVELVVVIAILGILAGVGTVGYSGYVKKANMAADQQLISNIENALTLAYYNGNLTEGTAGMVLIVPENAEDATPQCDEESAAAMEQAFGVNWTDALRLKYDKWGVKSMTLSYEDATAVVNSHFTQKYSTDELLGQVQAMTNAVNGLSFDVGETEVKLLDMYKYETADGTGSVIDDVIAEYGINKTWDEMTNTERSNVLVLATASSATSGTPVQAMNYLPQYALYTAFAADNAQFNEDYKTFQNTINDVEPDEADSEYNQIKNAYKTLERAATAYGFDEWKAGNSNVNNTAFNAIMAGVGNAMKDNGNAIIADLSNPDMFTSGIGYDMYNDYLSSAYATAAGEDNTINDIFDMITDGTLPGAVLVQYTVANGNLHMANTLPLN